MKPKTHKIFIMTTKMKYTLLAISLSSAIIISCEKTKITVPPEVATFTNQSSGIYFITAPGVTYDVPVGVTTISDKDRTITFSVSSPTGAVQGTDYTLSGTSVLIPAGQTLGKIVVSGDFNSYSTGRKDTLVFTLNTPEVAPSDYNGSFKLLMRGPCFDGDVTITDMAGDYTKTFENASYGPYTTTISGIISTSATTGKGSIDNLYDSFGPVEIRFDWTDPSNTMVEIPLQKTDLEYDVGQPFYVRTKPGASNKFSVCNQQLAFILDVLVDINGTLYYYDNGVEYTMAR